MEWNHSCTQKLRLWTAVKGGIELERIYVIIWTQLRRVKNVIIIHWPSVFNLIMIMIVFILLIVILIHIVTFRDIFVNLRMISKLKTDLKEKLCACLMLGTLVIYLRLLHLQILKQCWNKRKLSFWRQGYIQVKLGHHIW